MVFETFVNKSTLYKVKRVFDNELGVGWLYNWVVESSIGVNDDFYVIEGITPGEEAETWTYNSCVTITFNRTTSTNPYETFNVICRVKIMNGGVETCEQTKITNVIVKTDTTPVVCNGYLDTEPSTNCIFSGVDYVYKFCCNDTIDFVYFSIKNGLAYDLTGIQYPVTENIRVVPDIDNCARIVVRWFETDPTLPGFSISAYAKKANKYSPVIVRNEKAIPLEPLATLIGDDALVYDSGTNVYTVNVSKLTRYPQDYEIVVEYRRMYEFETEWSEWVYMGSTPELISDLAIPFRNPTIPYSYDFTYIESLDAYVNGDPRYVDLEFRVTLYDSTYDYHVYYHETENCITQKTLTKHVRFLYCPIDINFGGDYHYDEEFNVDIVTCPDEDTDIIFGGSSGTDDEFSYEYHWCYDTDMTLGSSGCASWCYTTDITLGSSGCASWCYDTDITLGSSGCAIKCFTTDITVRQACMHFSSSGSPGVGGGPI